MDKKARLARAVKDGVKSAIFHHLLPDRYKSICKDRPVAAGKAVFLEEYDDHLTDNLLAVARELKERGGYRIVPVFLRNGRDSYGAYIRRMLAAVDQIANAQAVFLSESSGLISCLPIRKETTVVQLWHACGAFKKFGLSLSDKRYGASAQELARFPMHRNFDYVTVSSPEVAWAYAEAFGMEDRKERIVPTGIARTDLYFREERIRRAIKKLHRNAPRLFDGPDRKIVLYAPTFRGEQRTASTPQELDFGKLKEALGDRYVFVCKHHPFVKERPAIPNELASFVCDVSDTMQIEDLLLAADVCISDYSSLIFEYSLLERPMLFFAYDLDDYDDWRGFYYPYEEMTPGPVLKTTGEIADALLHLEERFDAQEVRAFRRKYMSACDGHASARIADLVFSNEEE